MVESAVEVCRAAPRWLVELARPMRLGRELAALRRASKPTTEPRQVGSDPISDREDVA